MIKTLRFSFSLRNTYRVNCILYALKQAPLIGKVIPDEVYEVRAFLIFANVISILWEVISAFVGKIFYFLVIFLATSLLTEEFYRGGEVRLMLHILVLLSLTGAALNSYLFHPSRDKYYAIFLLGMNAKEYTLVNYFYALIKLLAGFTLCAFVFFFTAGAPVWECLLIPLSVAGVKMTADACRLWKYERKGTVKDEGVLYQCVQVCFLLLPLVAAIGLPVLGYALPQVASAIVMGLFLLTGLLSLRKILTFRSYRAMMQEFLFYGLALQMDDNAQKELQQSMRTKTISADRGITSRKKGFEFLNELFIKRHRKILWRAVLLQTAVVCVLTVGLLIVLPFFPEIRELSEMILSLFPSSVFIMYLLNRGTSFTRALFVNCDHSLLTYSFYKQPKYILKLFTIRLREIIKVNLLPALFMSGGLVLFLFVSGGTAGPVDYAVVSVSIPCLSIFFSVHYLTLYYLLQPYNAGTEIKSVAYQVITGATYFVSYVLLGLEIPFLAFGIGCIAFCILYCVVASILVYRLAPKTFKIKA